MLKTASQIADEVLWKLAFQGRLGFESSRAGSAVVPQIKEMLSASKPPRFTPVAVSKAPSPPKPELPKPAKPPPSPPPPQVQIARQSEGKQPATKPLLLGRMGS